VLEVAVGAEMECEQNGDDLAVGKRGLAVATGLARVAKKQLFAVLGFK